MLFEAAKFVILYYATIDDGHICLTGKDSGDVKHAAQGSLGFKLALPFYSKTEPFLSIYNIPGTMSGTS